MAISKADPPGEFVPAAERPRSVPTEDYPYQVVAEIAARLLVDDDYAGAAKRAIALIGACRHELGERRKNADVMNQAHANARDLDEQTPKRDGQNYQMSWKDALKYITGEERAERALPQFKKYLSYLFRWSEANRRKVPYDQTSIPSEESIIARLEQFRTEGIFSVAAHKYQANYPQWQVFDSKERARAAALARKNKVA